MVQGISLCDFLAGWIGGMMGIAVGHPLDTLKVRQQTSAGKTKITDLAKATYKLEGVPGFFRGLSYPLMGAGLYNALFFGVYGNTLRYLQGSRGNPERKMCCEGEPVTGNWHADVFLSGCVGGCATVVYACPLEMVKIKLQAQTDVTPNIHPLETHYKGPFHALKTIYKNHGMIRGLYKGGICMFWRDVPTFGVYTVSYEHILCMFKEHSDRSSDTSVISQVMAGGIAGVLSWVLVAPLDVVKTRIQADDFLHPTYNGMIDCIRKTYNREGMKALFLGTWLMCIRAFPVNAVTFVGYEWVIRFCDKKQKGPHEHLLPHSHPIEK